MIPCLAWYGFFVYRPILQGLWLSAFHYSLVDPGASRFAGLENFVSLFTYQTFWTAMENTFVYAAALYAFSIPSALLLAWCLTTVKRGRRFYEFIVFLPVVTSLVAIAVLFRMLMDPQAGAIDSVLRSLHLPTSQWIYGSSTALISIVLVDFWRGLGFYVVLLSGAMLAVPGDRYDAAKIDGASAWGLFRHVTLPGIMPTLSLVSVITFINGFQVYVTPVVLGPGPGTSTLVLNQFIVQTAFTDFNIGLAAAASVVLFVIIVALTLIQMRVLSPRNEGVLA